MEIFNILSRRGKFCCEVGEKKCGKIKDPIHSFINISSVSKVSFKKLISYFSCPEIYSQSSLNLVYLLVLFLIFFENKLQTF